MIVYRIQNDKGAGPYCGTKVDEYPEIDDMCERHSEDLVMWPQPEDEGLVREDKHKCCFLSLEGLRNWFSIEDIEMLERYGFYIETIEAEVYDSSDKQALCII